MRLHSHLSIAPLCLVWTASLAQCDSWSPGATSQLRQEAQKYFGESSFSRSYDGRFADHVLEKEDQRAAAKVLIQTYLATFRDLGIDTWIMQGSLLGWWWNKKSLPWDDHAKVMIMETSLYRLAAYYNMTTYYFEYSAIPKGRKFLLEINPYYTIRDQGDKMNPVDARWIDMENGIFLDITAARYDPSHPKGQGVMVCKDGHEFMDTSVFPLVDTTFEGVAVKIPFKYQDFLKKEYGQEALTNKVLENHHFDDEQAEWVPVTK